MLEFPKVEVAGSNPVPRSPKSSPISGRMFQPGAVLGVLIARPGPTLGPISFFSARAAEPNFFQFGHNAEHSTAAIGTQPVFKGPYLDVTHKNGERALCQRGFTGIAAVLPVGADEAATLVSGALPVQRCHVANGGVVSSPPVTLARWDRQPLETAPPAR